MIQALFCVVTIVTKKLSVECSSDIVIQALFFFTIVTKNIHMCDNPIVRLCKIISVLFPHLSQTGLVGDEITKSIDEKERRK